MHVVIAADYPRVIFFLLFHQTTVAEGNIDTIVLVHAIKTIEFKYRLYSNKRRRPDTIKIKRC